jgi:hypothetical protein
MPKVLGMERKAGKVPVRVTLTAQLRAKREWTWKAWTVRREPRKKLKKEKEAANQMSKLTLAQMQEAMEVTRRKRTATGTGTVSLKLLLKQLWLLLEGKMALKELRLLQILNLKLEALRRRVLRAVSPRAKRRNQMTKIKLKLLLGRHLPRPRED